MLIFKGLDDVNFAFFPNPRKNLIFREDLQMDFDAICHILIKSMQFITVTRDSHSSAIQNWFATCC